MPAGVGVGLGVSNFTATLLTTVGLLPRWLLFSLLGRLPQHELGVEGESLQNDVEALAVVVKECEADVEPIVVLALARNNRIDAETLVDCRCSCRALLCCGESCTSRRQGACPEACR
jgi:hypothetical protein